MAVHGLEPGAFIYIADSAMGTKKNLLTIGAGALFISHLPAGSACELLRKPLERINGRIWVYYPIQGIYLSWKVHRSK